MSGLILLQTVLRSDGILYSMKFIEKKSRKDTWHLISSLKF